MIKRLATTLSTVAILTLVTPPAHAIFGIGDVSYDPTVHAELVSMYNQAVEAYKVADQTLQRMQKMQETVEEASRAYDKLVNLDLNKVAEGLKPGQYMKTANNSNRIRAMRAELARLKNNSEGTARFVDGQLSRIDDLEKMVGLQDAAVANAAKASTDVDVRRSGQITAQSTATLSALAAAEEQRRQTSDLAMAAEAQRQRELLNESAKIYGSWK